MTAKSSIEAPTPGTIRRLAGERNFARGEAYFDQGRVRSMLTQRAGVKAIVQGTRRYSVRLTLQDGEIEHDCTCPIGDDGEFCKHCVAVALAWHAGGGADASDAPESPGEDEVRAYLAGKDKDELVSMLIEQALEDERLWRRLTVRSAPEATAPAVWKQAFDSAIQTADFVSYGEAHDYARDIDAVIDNLEEMLHGGKAARVVGLAEDAVQEIEEALDHVDDSEGEMGGLLHRLQDIHLEACKMAQPDPVELAERLVELELDSSYHSFHQAAASYAEVLGESGLATYHRVLEAEWAAIPELGPGDERQSYFGRRWQITSMMAALATAEGDIEALVAVKSRDLSSPYAFLEIAEIYREAGRPEAGLEWAERGWRAFPAERQDERLRDFLADAYQHRQRHDEALALVWQGFADRPQIETYRRLASHAKRARQWPIWRERALALVRERLAGKSGVSSRRPSPWDDASTGRSLLVEIFLEEGDADAAWREAEAGGCTRSLWLKLAAARAAEHPADSVRVYQMHIAALLKNTGDAVYREVVTFLERVEILLKRLDDEAAFARYVAELRETHRRKRNLMRLLDERAW